MQVKLLISPRHRVILSSKLVRYSRPTIRAWLRHTDQATDRHFRLHPDSDPFEYVANHPSAMPTLQFRFEDTGTWARGWHEPLSPR